MSAITEMLYSYSSDATSGSDAVDIRVVVAPAQEPVSLADVGAWVRVRGSHHDELLASILQGSRRLIESHTGMAFVDQTIKQVHNNPCRFIKLAVSPAKSITSVKYVPDWNANVQTTLASSAYVLAGDKLASANTWPAHRGWQSFEIQYVAGFGANAEEVKANGEATDLMIALKAVVTHFYNNPGDFAAVAAGTLGQDGVPIPSVIQSILNMNRSWEI